MVLGAAYFDEWTLVGVVVVAVALLDGVFGWDDGGFGGVGQGYFWLFWGVVRVVDGVVLVVMWFGKVGGLFVEESMSIVLILLVVLI